MKMTDKGMSLVEVLMATTILSFVGVAAFQFLSQTNKTYAKIDNSKIDKLLEMRLSRVLENEIYCKEIFSQSNPNFSALSSGDLSIPTSIIDKKYFALYDMNISFSASTKKDFSDLISKSSLKDKNLSLEHDISRSFVFSKILLINKPELALMAATTPDGELFSMTVSTRFEVAKVEGKNFTQKHYTSTLKRPIPITFVFQKNVSGISLNKCYARGSRAVMAATQICNSMGGVYNDAKGCNFLKFKGREATYGQNIRFKKDSDTSKMDIQNYLCNLDKKVVLFEKQDQDAVYGSPIDLFKASMSSWNQFIVSSNFGGSLGGLSNVSNVIIPAKKGNPNAKTSYCPNN